ncbi:MAG: FimV/HubP family polar landmark protein [Rhodocyclaceae bacterium]|nr:FimV/HubP family polar landmark protein [Rhodocyclaceae bacterium]
MFRRTGLMTVVFCLTMIAVGAQAAGLGRLTVLSSLGKPLQAELEISATAEELLSLSAQIASPEVFAQKGLERSAGVASIQFSLEKRKDGTPFLRAVSDQPIQSPSVSLLVELNWAAGRVLREYTFLLDPPEALKTSASPPQTATLSIAYLVKRGDTLGKIANETRPEGVHLTQVLVALFNANREAFDDGNMNRIQAGRTLNIPDAETVRAVDPSEARKIIIAQAREFDSYRGVLATTIASAPVMPEATPQQSATGKVMPKIEEKMPPSGEDKLTISRTEMIKPDAPARAAALEEDLVAREKELQEAAGRVTKLEKTVDELKQLADLKEQPTPSTAATPTPTPVATTPALTLTTTPVSSSSVSKWATVVAWISHPVVIGILATLLLLPLGWIGWRRFKDRNAMTPSAPLGDDTTDEGVWEEESSPYVAQPVEEQPFFSEREPIWSPVQEPEKIQEPERIPEPEKISPVQKPEPVLEFDFKPAPEPTITLSEPSLLPEPDIAWQPSRREEIPPLDFSSISLELEQSVQSPVSADESFEKDNPEVTTKLELAQAYEEMGDIEGARELLKEVFNEGNRRQREAAEAKLLHLGDA